MNDIAEDMERPSIGITPNISVPVDQWCKEEDDDNRRT